MLGIVSKSSRVNRSVALVIISKAGRTLNRHLEFRRLQVHVRHLPSIVSPLRLMISDSSETKVVPEYLVGSLNSALIDAPRSSSVQFDKLPLTTKFGTKIVGWRC